MTTNNDPSEHQGNDTQQVKPKLPYWRRVFELILGRNWMTPSSPDEEAQLELPPPGTAEPQIDAVISPQPSTREKDPNPESPSEEKLKLLKEITKYAGWGNAEGNRELEPLIVAFSEAYPQDKDLLDKAIEDGHHIKDYLDQAYRIGSKKGKSSSEARELLERVRRNHPWALNTIKNKLEKGDCARRRYDSEIRNPYNGKKTNIRPRKAMGSNMAGSWKPIENLNRIKGTLPSSNELHGSDLRAATPCHKWTVLIDEGGNEFTDENAKFGLGKFVALIVPGDEWPLEPLPGWHATECPSNEEIDRVFQAVLDAPVYVFGVSLHSVPKVPGERWMDGVALLIDWILRLLPIDAPTQIDVLIENRGAFDKHQSLALVERECLRRLAFAFPTRAAAVNLSMRIISKHGSPLNGYVDAVAFTWSSPSGVSKERLRQSELLGPCLLTMGARELLGFWDAFAQGVHLSGSEWWSLLPLGDNPSALAANLLAGIGHEARQLPSVWDVFLKETGRQMASGPVDLRALSRAVDWLETWAPAEKQILPLMRLIWLTVKLARSNHMGASENAWEHEMEQLEALLFDEAAPSVCHADLHLAVARTNRFDFANAGKSLAKWDSQPMAVPGLKYWGQVQSSLGQHHAFTGNNAAAVACFDRALAAFAKLSDPDIRAKECEQTGVYRAIAVMDDTGSSDEDVRNAMIAVFGKLDVSTVEKLATSNDPRSRYMHHLLLRWLVNRGDKDLENTYLSLRDKWQLGEGHPWPLIELYRAIILHPLDPKEAMSHALSATDLAFSANQGPVVRMIGACCRTIAAHWGETWTHSEQEIQSLSTELPFAGNHLQNLKNGVMEDDPRKFLSKCLPFNFR